MTKQKDEHNKICPNEYIQQFITTKPPSRETAKYASEWASSQLKRQNQSKVLSLEDGQNQKSISSQALDEKTLKHLSEMEQIEDRKDIADRLLLIFQTSIFIYAILVGIVFGVSKDKALFKQMAPVIINTQTPLVYVALGYYFAKKK